MDKKKKKGIKIYALIVVLALAAGLLSPYVPHLAFHWDSSSDTEEEEWKAREMDYEAVVANTWVGLSESGSLAGGEDALPGTEKGVLFHNDGQFMDCNLLASEGGCQLVGVYCFKFWGQVPVESYYFSNQPFADEESLLAWILPEQYSHSTQLMGRGFDFQAKNFSFAFLDEEGGVQSSVTTRALAEKKHENAVINGIPGTIWTVSLESGMETESSRGISALSTMLDVKADDQQLIHWDPLSSTAPIETTVSFSLTEGLQRTSRYTELPMIVDSSMHEDYGKWMYDIPQMPQRKLSMEPQMEVTNLDEALTAELQHTATVNTGIFRKEELDTGRIRVEFDDM